MIVISGATGNTGRRIAEMLLAAGEQVRVLGRSEEKLRPLGKRGAEVRVCDLSDPDETVRAFSGASAAYAMLPPNYQAPSVRAYQEAVGDSLAGAIRRAGVKHVVSLSSVGADKAERVGPVVGLHFFEQKLNAIPGLNVLHLRPGYFMENFFQYIKLIKSMGITAGTIKPDVPIAMIATRDIAVAAAERLRKRDFAGSSTRELLGPREYSMKQATAILGEAIGKPKLSYSQLPEMMVKPALTQMGMSKDAANGMLEMMEAINTGWMKAQEPRSAENTTPTTFEQFVKEEFAPAFQAR